MDERTFFRMSMGWPRGFGIGWWCLAIALLISGCPTGHDTTQGWIGHPRDELVQAWGAPAQETRLPDGGTLVLYSYNWDDGYGRHVCRRMFVTDARGVIRSASSVEC